MGSWEYHLTQRVRSFHIYFIRGPCNFLDRYSDASFTLTKQLGASVSFAFRGSSMSIFGSRFGDHGRYQVEVDGVSYPEQDGRADPPIFRTALFTMGDETQKLENGEHRARLVNKDNTLYLDVDQVRASLSAFLAPGIHFPFYPFPPQACSIS